MWFSYSTSDSLRPRGFPFELLLRLIGLKLSRLRYHRNLATYKLLSDSLVVHVVVIQLMCGRGRDVTRIMYSSSLLRDISHDTSRQQYTPTQNQSYSKPQQDPTGEIEPCKSTQIVQLDWYTVGVCIVCIAKYCASPR